ncbi:MAG: nucleotidyl transferase AbiEii/AbiGii toxin family protein [Candidatus Latescibacterota bacterium]
MLDLYEELRALVTSLADRRIDYALCGGLAMAVHGIPRATVDIDLVVLAEAIDQVKDLAQRLGFAMEAGPRRFREGAVEIHRLSKPDPESEDFVSLDLLVVTPLLREVWDSREVVAWEGAPLRVVSRAGLVILKSLRGSGQDRDDIARLQEGADED